MFHRLSINCDGSSDKNVSASWKAQNVEKGTIYASKPEVRKLEYDEEKSNFECYNKSDGKPVQVDIDKEVTEGGPALALLPSKSDEEIKNNDETMRRNSNNSVCRSNRTFEPLDWLRSLPYFWN